MNNERIQVGHIILDHSNGGISFDQGLKIDCIEGRSVITGNASLELKSGPNKVLIEKEDGNAIIIESPEISFSTIPKINGSGIVLRGQNLFLNDSVDGNSEITIRLSDGDIGILNRSGTKLGINSASLSPFTGLNIIELTPNNTYIKLPPNKNNFIAMDNEVIHNTGNEIINGLKTFTSGIDIYSGTNSQSLRVFNRTGTTSGEFGLFGWNNNELRIGATQTQNGLLRDVLLTGRNININASGLLNIFDPVNISGNLNVTGNLNISGTGIFSGIDLNNVDNLTLSGVDIIITGSTVNSYNNIFISGNSVLTGVNLTPYATTSQLISTGSRIDTLSGNLITTGTTLTNNLISTGSRIDVLSGQVVFTTGNQTISGAKTFLDTITFKKDIILSGATPWPNPNVSLGMEMSNGIYFDNFHESPYIKYYAGYENTLEIRSPGGSPGALKLLNGNEYIILDGDASAISYRAYAAHNFIGSPIFVDTISLQNIVGQGGNIDLNNSKLINAVPELINVTSNFNITGTQNSRMILANSNTQITGTIVSGNVTGFNTSIIQIGAGQIQITGSGAGIVISSYNNQFKTAGTFATISLLHTGNNRYIMYGNTA